MFAWEELLARFIAGLSVTQIITQFAATTVHASPITGFLQQTIYKYGFFT
jgi:hypothetical protein